MSPAASTATHRRGVSGGWVSSCANPTTPQTPWSVAHAAGLLCFRAPNVIRPTDRDDTPACGLNRHMKERAYEFQPVHPTALHRPRRPTQYQVGCVEGHQVATWPSRQHRDADRRGPVSYTHL